MKIDRDILQACWFLAGPTACGKTAVSLELAARLDAEIIALDSMTLYRGMDIGTAKPSLEERATVPHHLFDILDPHEDFSVAQYVVAAEKCCREILTRGRTPLFVGGAGLYLRSLLRGVFEGPAADLAYRAELEGRAVVDGGISLHADLMRVDAITATRLPPQDVRRVIRAMEVFHVTGQPISSQQQEQPILDDAAPLRVFWLDRPRSELHHRINLRVDEMFAAGLVEEVHRLRELPSGIGRTARQALGYKEVLDWLDAGTGSVTEAITTVQTRTRQFAKRQVTWFRNLVECRPVSLAEPETPATTVERVFTLATA